MSREVLDQCFKQLCDAIEACVGKDLTIPCLILIYSAIDIAGWLDSEDSRESVRNRFTRWVDRYLLPAKSLDCTAAELYGARCGVVRTFSPESGFSKKGIVRKIVYVSGSSEAGKLGEMITLGKMSNYVVVKLEDIFEAYRLAIDRFHRELENDAMRAEKIYGRAANIFKSVSDMEIKSLLEWREKLLKRS